MRITFALELRTGQQPRIDQAENHGRRGQHQDGHAQFENFSEIERVLKDGGRGEAEHAGHAVPEDELHHQQQCGALEQQRVSDRAPGFGSAIHQHRARQQAQQYGRQHPREGIYARAQHDPHEVRPDDFQCEENRARAERRCEQQANSPGEWRSGRRGRFSGGLGGAGQDGGQCANHRSDGKADPQRAA
jgi:hypothetical protein